MSRTPTHKWFFCERCKRYRKHARLAGEPVGELLYTCTAYKCGGVVNVQGVRQPEGLTPSPKTTSNP